MFNSRLLTSCFASLVLAACTTGGGTPDGTDGGSPIIDGRFVCLNAESRACLGAVHHSCVRDGEFLNVVRQDCPSMRGGDPAQELVCVDQLGCKYCRPDERFCVGNTVAMCDGTGDGYTAIETCAADQGFVCRSGRCENLCELAIAENSYVGCEFYAVDLDNLSGPGGDAARQQYSVVVSNPSGESTEVVIERNRAAPGQEPVIEEVERLVVPPGDLEVFNLPRREVDGSSSMLPCNTSSVCDVGETCYCRGGLAVESPAPEGGHRACRCRNAPETMGQNDGTHSALTSHAYRIRSVLPIIAYQFNPLDDVGVFSNDASLLLPTSAIGQNYPIVSWPQTIAHSDNPDQDFDPNSTTEDVRAFLTIVGTEAGTRVSVDFGQVGRVVGLGGYTDAFGGETWEFDLGAFDVLNLETQAFNADFTGSRVRSNRPVSVFVGSELSDAPRFERIGNRFCCADHLEEQAFPEDTLGRRFFVGRMPTRSAALNRAFIGGPMVGDFNEPEYVRLVAVQAGTTTVQTSLPPPRNTFDLVAGGRPCYDEEVFDNCGSVILTANQDFEINASGALAVAQVIASQQAAGIPNSLPGGDPALILVAPVEQFRREYVFLTPGLYAFDFVTIVAPREAEVELDRRPISEWDCEVAPADGVRRRDGDPPPEWVVYRCQFSFPEVSTNPLVIDDGMQRDGYHQLRATADIGVVVYGFDNFVSYAYSAGLDLEALQ